MHIIAKFQRTGVVICSQSREGKPRLIAKLIQYFQSISCVSINMYFLSSVWQN